MKTKYIILSLIIIIGIIIGTISIFLKPQSSISQERPVLTVGVLQNIQNLDPALTKLSDDANVYAQVYEGLLEYDPASEGLKGCLAERWTVSPDGLIYTFYIRKGIKFHDGTPLNATAVKLSLERAGNNSGAEYWRMVEYVNVIDDYIIQVILKFSFPPFEQLMAGIPKAVFYITSPTAVAKYGNLQTNPVGTGPYKFNEWIKDDHVTLTSNDEYWRGLPKFRKVIFKIFPDASTARLSLLNGEIDLLYDGLGATPPADLEYFATSPSFKFLSAPKDTVVFLFFWLPDPNRPTANVYLRKAIAHAINYDAIMNNIIGKAGIRALCFCTPKTSSYIPVLSQYDYNLTKASEYINMSGLQTPIKLKAGYYFKVPVRRDIFLAIQADLASIGIDIEIQAYELAAWMETYTTGANDIQISAWTALYSDPHGFAAFFLNASIPYPNNAHYYNPEYEEIVAQALNVTDQTERERLYKEAWTILADDLPAIPLYYPAAFWVTQTYITGIPDPYPLSHAYIGWIEKSEAT